MRLSAIILGLFLLIALADTPSRGEDERRPLAPSQKWTGFFFSKLDFQRKDAPKDDDASKVIHAPKLGYLTNQASFEKLWNSWGLRGEPPKLDFKKQIVFVQVAGTANEVSTTYVLDKNADLTAASYSALVQRLPGFGYGIDVLDRAGIKTYKGKPIE